jgi:hypothetical protein
MLVLHVKLHPKRTTTLEMREKYVWWVKIHRFKPIFGPLNCWLKKFEIRQFSGYSQTIQGDTHDLMKETDPCSLGFFKKRFEGTDFIKSNLPALTTFLITNFPYIKEGVLPLCLWGQTICMTIKHREILWFVRQGAILVTLFSFLKHLKVHLFSPLGHEKNEQTV